MSSLYVELSLKGGFSICTNGHGHGPLIKIAAMFIYGKTLKNLLLQNEESFEVKSLYIASGTQGYQVCSNDDHWLKLTS